MESENSHTVGGRTESWMALAFCSAAMGAGAVAQLIGERLGRAASFGWLPFAAAGLAVTGLLLLDGRPKWFRTRRALLWTNLLLAVWATSGLPLDLLRLTPLIPLPVDWSGLLSKMLACAATVVLARLALASPAHPASARAFAWYGYVAFLLALPYPALRTCWALGGTLGLSWPGAAGRGWLPWLASIPWLLAALLSLLLVPTWRWMPRRVLLFAGWSATAMVAMVGPAACWTLITRLVEGRDPGIHGIATWVIGLFYGSWLLWAIAAGAATRSYQLRTSSSAITCEA